MSVELIAEGTRVTRTFHRCYECHTSIPIRTRADFCTAKSDGRVYTLYSHTDCTEAALHWRADTYCSDYIDGAPPLMDEIADSGDYQKELDRLRGYFPHVVCRMEFWDQRHGRRA